MKKLFTALLLLIYIPAFGQDVEQARWHIEQALLALEEPEVPETPARVTASFLDSGHIEFWAQGLHHPWQHSVNQYLHRTPIDPEAGIYSLGVVENPDQYTWHIRMKVGKWESDVITVGPRSDTGEEAEEEAEQRFINFGMWYESDFGNVRRVWISEIPDSGNFIPRIGGFEADESESKWRQRLANRGRVLKDIDPSRVPFVIVRDEPFAKDFTTSQLERLIEIAKQEIGDQFNYTYTFTRSAIERGEQLPKNTNVIGINFYPFYLESCDWCEQIRTEQEFYAFFDEIMQKARANSSEGVEFSITGQAFYDQPDGKERWRKPPVEAPFWYMNFIQKNPDITTLLWFLEDTNRSWVGLDEMPEFRENLERVFEGIPPTN